MVESLTISVVNRFLIYRCWSVLAIVSSARATGMNKLPAIPADAECVPLTEDVRTLNTDQATGNSPETQLLISRNRRYTLPRVASG